MQERIKEIFDLERIRDFVEKNIHDSEVTKKNQKEGDKVKLYQLFDKHITGSKAKAPYNEYHFDKLNELLKKLPTGSGIDAGSTIAFEECTWNKIVFNSAFHVMDEHGFYDGWIEFKVIVRPSFTGFDLEIKPLQRKTYFNNYLHDYVFDVFWDALDSEIGSNE
jgi:hypothetical protein